MRAIMGTNFYWLSPFPLVKPIHLGKSSAGWCFALHVYPDGLPGLDEEDVKVFPTKDFNDWKELFKVKNSLIRDEYGEVHMADHMIRIITCRAWTSRTKTPSPQWNKENDATEGPFGLSRHAIGKFCIAHGEGTWDCCVGDFS